MGPSDCLALEEVAALELTLQFELIGRDAQVARSVVAEEIPTATARDVAGQHSNQAAVDENLANRAPSDAGAAGYKKI